VFSIFFFFCREMMGEVLRSGDGDAESSSVRSSSGEASDQFSNAEDRWDSACISSFNLFFVPGDFSGTDGEVPIERRGDSRLPRRTAEKAEGGRTGPENDARRGTGGVNVIKGESERGDPIDTEGRETPGPPGASPPTGGRDTGVGFSVNRFPNDGDDDERLRNESGLEEGDEWLGVLKEGDGHGEEKDGEGHGDENGEENSA